MGHALILIVIHMIYHKGLGQGPGSLPNHSHVLGKSGTEMWPLSQASQKHRRLRWSLVTAEHC